MNILDPGYDLNLRPMRYPQFFDMYKNAIKNTWTVEEINFSKDLEHLHDRITPAERHLVHRLVAFFATGDTIVSNNLVINFYQQINSPEARMYLSRQLFEEALHIQFYLNLLDNYIPDEEERQKAFQAVENIPSIRQKADFCQKWMDLGANPTDRQKLLNFICFGLCVEGLFFFAAFAYVYYLRSKGLLDGLATGTNWVFRDESCHINFIIEVINTIKRQEPELWDEELERHVYDMVEEAIRCEHAFAEDITQHKIPGLTHQDTLQYLRYTADQRLQQIGMRKRYNTTNPFPFMELQDVQELTNFFEKTVTAYQMVGKEEVVFDEDF